MQNRYTYPALFCCDDDGVPGIGVVFPDLPGCVSQGTDEADAMRMAKEALALHMFGMEEDGREIPAPTPLCELEPEPGQSPVLIDVWMPEYRSRIVTLPRQRDLRSHALQDVPKKLLGAESPAAV